MNVFRTHYENLQVAEHASPEVIRAAYRYLAQKYHPDRHLVNQDEANRIMTIINEAYAVLSDPVRRKEHDEWIRAKRLEEDLRESGEDTSESRPQEPHEAATDHSYSAFWSVRSEPPADRDASEGESARTKSSGSAEKAANEKSNLWIHILVWTIFCLLLIVYLSSR